jgi:predicted permease
MPDSIANSLGAVVRAAVASLWRRKLRSANIGLVLLFGSALGALAVSLAWLHARGDVPFPEQERLVRMQLAGSRLSMPLGWNFPYLDAVSQSSGLAQLVPYNEVVTPIVDASGNFVATSTVVNTDPRMFSLLGMNPASGRLFTQSEMRPGSEHVVVVGHKLAARILDPGAPLGDVWLTLAGERFRVIGVLAPSQAFPDDDSQIYAPLMVTAQERSIDNAGSFGAMQAIGLLRSDVSLQAVVQQAEALVSHNPGLTWVAGEVGLQITAEPIRRQWTGKTEGMIYAVCAASIILLIICVANSANLFLLGLVDRQGAFAVRQSLGASRSRLLIEILCEALLIVIGTLAIALSMAAIASAPIGEWVLGTRQVSAGLVAPLATVAALVCFGFVTVVATSAATILRTVDIQALRRGQGQTLTSAAKRVRTTLSVIQVCACVALAAVGAATSLNADTMMSRPMGFKSDGANIGTLREVPISGSMSVEPRRRQLAALLESLRQRPEFSAVGMASSVPFGETVEIQRFSDGAGISPELDQSYYISLVDPGYLRALGAELLRGSHFEMHDPLDGSVAIVEESFVRRFLGDVDPIGHSVRLESGESVRIVGVVGDVLERSMETHDAFPTLFRLVDVPFRTLGLPADDVAVVIRNRIPSNSIDRNWLAQELAQHADSFALVGFASVPATIEALAESQVQIAKLIRWYALLAAVLCTIAVYSLISHATSSSMREFALRLALGARRSDIISGVIRHGISIGLVGWLLGLSVAFAVLRIMGPEPVSAVLPQWLLLGLGASLISGFAALVPALKTSRVGLLAALRAE